MTPTSVSALPDERVEMIVRAIQRHASAYVARGSAISDSITAECVASREALLAAYLALLPVPSAKPAAWGRMIDGEAVTVSRLRTEANNEPLYASPPQAEAGREEIKRQLVRSFVAHGVSKISAPHLAECALDTFALSSPVEEVRAAVIEECARIVERWSLPTVQTASMWLVDQAGIAAEIRALNSHPSTGTDGE